MYEAQVSDFYVGQEVRAFHPRTLGVMYSGTVTALGRKYVSVRFGVDGKVYRLPAVHVAL